MDSILKEISEFPRQNPLFMKMADADSEVEFYLEVLFNNKLELARYYHNPNMFFMMCNNSISVIETFINRGQKQKGKNDWYYEGVNKFERENKKYYRILRELRNKTMHFKMIIPENAISFGLYRIESNSSYIQKIGMGNDKHSNDLPAFRLAQRSEVLFHDLLQMHYLFFIDIEHSAFGECLGLTRRWYVNVAYKENNKTVNEKIDIYDFLSSCYQSVFNSVCLSFSQKIGIEYKQLTLYESSEYNFVNTLLEIDLYPSLFKTWWGTSGEPLNWGSLLDYRNAIDINDRVKASEKVISLLPKTIDDYFVMLNKFKKVQIEDFISQDQYNLFIYFISLQHWFIKPLNIKQLMEKFNIDILYQLHSLATKYIHEIDMTFDKHPSNEINKRLGEICLVLQKMENELELIYGK